jgi:predicted RNase H-like HicB family nuclease
MFQITILLCRRSDMLPDGVSRGHHGGPRGRGYNASCPVLPGCHSEGATIEEALEGIREAIACYLESRAIDDVPVPASVITEVEVA